MQMLQREVPDTEALIDDFAMMEWLSSKRHILDHRLHVTNLTARDIELTGRYIFSRHITASSQPSKFSDPLCELRLLQR